MDCRVKLSCELVDLLEVDGKFDNVIEEDDVSFVCEKLLKLVELTTALRKLEGSVKTTVS